MSKRSVPSIILYICAVLVAAFAIWSYTYCADIISQAKAAGQLAASGNEYDIASFYMGNCGQYFIYALLLAAVGLLLQRIQPMQNAPGSSSEALQGKVRDDELDEWFSGAEFIESAETEDV